MDRKWVYVAGPYSTGDQVINTRNAVQMALALLGVGLVPICPHLSMLAHLISPQPYEFWMAWDFAMLERCDALLRLPGESSGADREVARAHDLHLPIFSPADVTDPGSTAREVAQQLRGNP
jgi:hypothetical protein